MGLHARCLLNPDDRLGTRLVRYCPVAPGEQGTQLSENGMNRCLNGLVRG